MTKPPPEAVKFPEGVAGSWAMLLRSRRRSIDPPTHTVEAVGDETDRLIVFDGEPR